MANLIAKLPYLITGDNFETLKKYDANSRKKINVLGWFAFIPAFLWFLTGYLLCVNLLETSVLVGLITGGLAAFIIFIFERSVVQSKKVKGFLMLVRLSLALFVGSISSVVLDLVIFDNDIKTYAGSGLISKQDSMVQIAKADYQHAEKVFNQEMDGTSGSKLSGYGVIAKEKKAQMLEAQRKLELEQSKLERFKTILNDSTGSSEFKGELGLDTILNRLVLLHKFVMNNKVALAAWIIFLLIGLLLEVFGVLTKCLYPKSAYEMDEEAREVIIANRRRQVLEQSAYYTDLGFHGRSAKEALATNRQLLN